MSIILAPAFSAAQPQATLKVKPQTVPLNRELCVTLELAWAGEADVYDIPPPDISPLAAFEALERSLSTAREDGQNLLRHEFVMKPLVEGEHDLGRMIVTYYEKGVDIPTTIPLSRTMVKVVPRELVPRGVINGIIIGLLSAAVGLAVFFATQRKKSLRRERIDSAMDSKRRREELSADLSNALILRMEGDMGAYLEKLCALTDSDELRAHAGKIEELRDLAESVKFGGLTPSPDQLRWAEKMVKNAIEKAYPADDEMEQDQP